MRLGVLCRPCPRPGTGGFSPSGKGGDIELFYACVCVCVCEGWGVCA